MIQQRFIQRNFNPTKGRKVTKIVLHTFDGVGTSLFNWFNSVRKDPTSAHYVVLFSGEIEQYVREQDIAWHAGSGKWNAISIGIEHQDNGDPEDKVRTKKLYDASIQLCAEICLRHNLDPHTCFVLHRHISKGRSCPGRLDWVKIQQGTIKLVEKERNKMAITLKSLQEDLSKERVLNDKLRLENQTLIKDFAAAQSSIVGLEIKVKELDKLLKDSLEREEALSNMLAKAKGWQENQSNFLLNLLRGIVKKILERGR